MACRGAVPNIGYGAPLERYFEFKKLNTTWKTEILAGVTTFITMAYIVFVNPAILKDAGMPVPAVFAATCLAAAFGSILMGAFARYPIALAPGMGLNAYFTYTVVKGHGRTVANGAGCGVSVGRGVPDSYRDGHSAMDHRGNPLGAIRRSERWDWPVHRLRRTAQRRNREGRSSDHRLHGKPARSERRARGVRHPDDCDAQAWKVRAAILLGILSTTAVGAVAGLVHWQPQSYQWSDISATMLHLDIRGALGLGLLEIVFVFLFVDLFDNMGTLMGVSKKAGLLEAGNSQPGNRIPRLNRILLTDATATIGGSLLGTTTVVSYIESAAGVAAGGRTGVTSIVTGCSSSRPCSSRH